MVKWSIEFSISAMPPIKILDFEPDNFTDLYSTEIENFKIIIKPEMKNNYLSIKISVESLNTERDCFISLRCTGESELYSFSDVCNKRIVMRQSPHDPSNHNLSKMIKQPVPMAALKTNDGFYFAVSDTPASFDNQTTQTFDPQAGYFLISSGDNGEQANDEGIDFPYSSHITKKGVPHTFTLLISRSKAQSIQSLRQDVFEVIAEQWGEISSPYHALAFATNYMHFRKNETGYSNHWIIPGIEYANKQYTRDAFWQSMILPLAMEQQIYDAVYEERYKYAENAMLYIIWTARLKRSGGVPNIERAKDALKFITQNTIDGCYKTPRSKELQHGKMMRSWYDICDFEDDDVITYNQGLLATALFGAQELSLPTSLSIEQSVTAYQNLFNVEKGFFPLSRDKMAMCVDALVGDLLSIVFFDQPILPTNMVKLHFDAMNNIARTDVGYKVTCDITGNYLPPEFYCTDGNIIPDYQHPNKGQYSWGGSYFIYDMLALLTAVAHKVEGAEEAAYWRTAVEIKIGGTYHENLNTLTKMPGKPNQGWNAAIYALWTIMMEKGLVSDNYLRKVDKLITALK